MSEREFLAEHAQSGPPEATPAHEALLEQYLHLLQADPSLLAAAAQSGREQTLQWAADELKHTAATLGDLPLEDAQYELERVLRELRERLEVPEDRAWPHADRDRDPSLHEEQLPS
ncbi:hypothetical protein [Hyalangium gracile]|uniref:hypothetical protein n=1 Tax=Hyalangium gracile TaxID=394092 RepID=UPI001CCA4122|nr:hypothetical protein [Hyalangium gracile]